MTASTREFAHPGRAAWIREIDLALPVTNQFVLTGNVQDLHLSTRVNGAQGGFVTTIELLVQCLAANEYDLVYRYDPVDGIVLDHVLEGFSSSTFFPDTHLGRATIATVGRLADLIKHATSTIEVRVAVVVDWAARLWGDESAAGPELRNLLLASQKLTRVPGGQVLRSGRPVPLCNCVFWMSENEADAPAWLSASDSTRIISIPSPTLGVRKLAAQELVGELPHIGRLDEAQRADAVDAMAESTQGMTLRSMRSAAVLAVDGNIAAEHIDEAVRSYRAGVLENPWQDPLLLERIGRAESIVEARVLGQSRAVRRSLDILLRSAVGLTGAQSRTGRPQGILFFAGPTGVGKTELAKSLAEVLFGAEDAYTRFDMSEFSAEHSEARLIGAPPGYIGHSAGGELTNAVRQKPFSILLFDEIEKAHPRILDKFLQILEDGRLTDGGGHTVYFSETVVVFTSNLGASQLLVDHQLHGGTASAEPEELIRGVIERHFTEVLGRPELLNRIGDNIIVFDAISASVGRQLVRKYLSTVTAVVRQKHGVQLQIRSGVASAVESVALTKLSFGGRGVGSAVESAFINPLARALFELSPTHDVVVAEELQPVLGGGWRLVLSSS